jgi:hypothetical protein
VGWERVNLPIETPEPNVRVALQDQHSEMVVVPLHIMINDSATLNVATAKDDMTVTLDPGHGAVAGNALIIKEGIHFYFAIILGVATNVLTMDTPLDHAFSTSAFVNVANANLNVNGDATAKIAEASPPPGVKWDITRVHVRMVDNDVMDAGTFAGRAALPKGVVLRNTNGEAKNVANAKTNGDLALMASAYAFDDKPPSGAYGFTSNHVFGGQHHVGVTMRLDGSDGDRIEAIIQDDLTTVTLVKMVAVGHVVVD